MIFRAALALSLTLALSAQVIEYDANGLKYQTLTRKGLTVIVTHLPNHVAGFGLLQVSISNGSDFYWTVGPEDFVFIDEAGGKPGDEEFPNTGIMAQAHRVASAVPAIKVTDNRNAACIWRPHCKAYTRYLINRHQLRAQATRKIPMLTLFQQVEVEIA